VLIYWHVERKSMVIHSQLINCIASEVAAMVDGAMHHGTEMDVAANYVDTHGQSVIGFGLTRLLGFDLLPRIKRGNHLRLYPAQVGGRDAYPLLVPALCRSGARAGCAPRACSRSNPARCHRAGRTAPTRPSAWVRDPSHQVTRK
jgi:TnpA family transposase